jgi:hypothetical protein
MQKLSLDAVIPDAGLSLEAIDDAAVLLTAVPRNHPWRQSLTFSMTAAGS